MSVQSSSGYLVSFAQRCALLGGVPALAALPHKALAALASSLGEETYPIGYVLMTEGEVGHHAYLIVEGSVEVSAAGSSGPIPLETRGTGEIVGELALLTDDARRTATVTVLTDVRLLSLSISALHQVLTAHPAVSDAFSAGAERTLIFKFLKQASPFAPINQPNLRALAERVEHITVPSGAVIIKQGDLGDTCYLLRSGRVEVLVRMEDGLDRRIETHGPGRLFGEAALLTDAPRNATVRAVEPCQLLVLRRTDLLHVMRADQSASKYIIDLVYLRDRPRQVPGILAYHRTTAEGETVTILKDPRRAAYFQLSRQGWFVWQHLDGDHNHRDLTLAYFTETKTFAPQAIGETVGSLAAAGFTIGTRQRSDVEQSLFGRSSWERMILHVRHLLNWQIALNNLDGPVTAVYRAVVRLLYTTPAQITLAAVTLGGIVAFALTATRASTIVLGSPGGMRLLWFFLPALLVSVLIHEAGHAFTTKAFGHEVARAGIGWYWFGPMAFVDTSDMWLAGRWPRIAVSLAGPYTNLITGSISALAAWLSRNPTTTAALSQFALISYIIVLRNLNPLLELDGYFVLSDWLECPNLRERAFTWIRNEMPRALRMRDRLRGHWLDLGYGLAALAYMVIVVLLTTISYRLWVQEWIGHVLPATLATALAWALAGGLVILYAAGIASELRGRPDRPRSA